MAKITLNLSDEQILKVIKAAKDSVTDVNTWLRIAIDFRLAEEATPSHQAMLANYRKRVSK